MSFVVGASFSRSARKFLRHYKAVPAMGQGGNLKVKASPLTQKKKLSNFFIYYNISRSVSQLLHFFWNFFRVPPFWLRIVSEPQVSYLQIFSLNFFLDPNFSLIFFFLELFSNYSTVFFRNRLLFPKFFPSATLFLKFF